MNPGRAMAQAAHAANQFIHEYGRQEAVKTWQKDANGFGTTICLAATVNDIYEVITVAKRKKHCAGFVYDPTYKFDLPTELVSISGLINEKLLTAPTIYKEDGNCMLFRNELTCAYLFIDQNNPDREMLVGNMRLHP